MSRLSILVLSFGLSAGLSLGIAQAKPAKPAKPAPAKPASVDSACPAEATRQPRSPNLH